MLQSDRIDELFDLIQTMTLSKRAQHGIRPSDKLQRLEKGLLVAYITTMAVFGSVAVWSRFSAPSQQVVSVLMGIYIANLCLALLYLAAVAINIGGGLWRHRKKPLTAILANLNFDLRQDANFLTRLWAFDKATLQYGLLQYRHCWDAFDSRVAALSGELRKIGLFPAIAAASVSASSLLKSDSNLFLWLPLCLAACFYLVSLYALGQRERPQQVIALLEYAVLHADGTTKSLVSHVSKSASGRPVKWRRNAARSSSDRANHDAW